MQAGKPRMEAPADLVSGESSLLGLQTLPPSPGRRGQPCACHTPTSAGGVPADGPHQLLDARGTQAPTFETAQGHP